VLVETFVTSALTTPAVDDSLRWTENDHIRVWAQRLPDITLMAPTWLPGSTGAYAQPVQDNYAYGTGNFYQRMSGYINSSISGTYQLRMNNTAGPGGDDVKVGKMIPRWCTMVHGLRIIFID
jgi:hypothetical protein